MHFLSALFLAGALSLSMAAFAAESSVPVRIGTHKAYTRIVFDFPKLLAYHPKSSGDNLQIIFDTQALAAIASTKSPLIKKITATPDSNGTLKVDVALAAGAIFKHYRLQRKVVVDIYPSGAKPQMLSPAATTVAENKPKKTVAPPQLGATVTPAVVPVSVPVPPVPITAAPAALAIKAETAELPPVHETVRDKPAVASAEILSIPPLPVPAVQEVAPEKKPEVHETAEASEEAGSLDVTDITLSSLAPMRLAVFERSNALWIVTDSVAASSSLPVITGPMSAFIVSPKILKFDGGTAYRYLFPKKFYFSVRKQNLSWVVSLLSAPPAVHPSAEIRVEFDRTSRKSKLLVPLKGAGASITFEDPVVGDTLYVVPTSQPDQAIQNARHLPDLEIIPTALTGMVIRPLKDNVTVYTAHDFAILTSPSGLSVTPEGTGAAALIGEVDEVSDSDSVRLFDFPNWRQGGLKKLQENKQKLQEKIVSAATPEERAGFLMKMAILYFANNFGQEALGILDLVEKENPNIDKNPDFIAIRGAANAMSGYYKEALKDFSFPAIQQNPEVHLWIGFTAAASEQWRMADRYFPRNNRLLLQYPDNIAIPFTVYMAESALHLGHTDTAKKLLNSINTTSDMLTPQYKAAIGYLRGETFAQEGKLDEAAEVWQPVARGLDRLYHTKASLSLARLLQRQNKITLKEAIEQVDNLRFAWRGDGLEVEILRTLGSLKVQDNQALSGLQDLKQAAELADYMLDDSTLIRDEMKRIFSELFVGGLAGKITPLEAVSVYNEFNNLMPSGVEGKTAALNFADYLISMDLLERAEEIIEEQIKIGLPDDKVTPIGTKLAVVYLLDARPSQALETLGRTEKGSLTDKDREERNLIRARAQSQLNQTAAAISTLSTMNSKNAQKLKADVLWRAQKWSEAAETIETIIPPAGKPLTEEDASFIVNAAVAWKLTGNTDKLKEIKDKYLASMAETQLAATFGVVTRDGGASALADRESVLKIAGEVDMFKGFLDNYKAAAGKGS